MPSPLALSISLRDHVLPVGDGGVTRRAVGVVHGGRQTGAHDRNLPEGIEGHPALAVGVFPVAGVKVRRRGSVEAEAVGDLGRVSRRR